MAITINIDGQTLAQVLAKGKQTGEQSIESDNSYSVAEIINGYAKLSYRDGSTFAHTLEMNPSELVLSYFGSGVNGSVYITPTSNELTHDVAISLNSPLINLPQVTASRLLSTDVSQNVAPITGTGFIKVTSGVISYDTSTYLTSAVTSVSGTANEIFSTGGNTPVLSLPAALTFTGKTITGGTYSSPILTTPSIGVASGTSLTLSALTSGRVTFASTSGILTDDSKFLWNNTSKYLGIGATPDAELTVSKQTTIVAPPSGTLMHLVGLDANPLVICLDTHDNVNAGGAAFRGRRSRGTAGSPSAVQSGDTLLTMNAVGYGTTGYGAASTGLISIKANQAFTDTAMGTYISLFTTTDASVTAVEALRVLGNGKVNITQATGALQINGTDVITPTLLGSAVMVPKAQVTGYQGYVLSTNSGSLNPADSTTYYYGAVLVTVPTTANQSYLVIPKTGTIKRIDVIITNSGTGGSTETSTFSFRLNNTTDTTISSAITTNLAIQKFVNSALNIDVVAGDTYEYKWDTPAYATNPTVIRISFTTYIE